MAVPNLPKLLLPPRSSSPTADGTCATTIKAVESAAVSAPWAADIPTTLRNICHSMDSMNDRINEHELHIKLDLLWKKDAQRPVADPGMRVRTYAVLERAVEEGVAAGLRHFFKHRDPPEGFEALEDGLREKISDDVMQSITEWFDFPDGDL